MLPEPRFHQPAVRRLERPTWNVWKVHGIRSKNPRKTGKNPSSPTPRAGKHHEKPQFISGFSPKPTRRVSLWQSFVNKV